MDMTQPQEAVLDLENIKNQITLSEGELLRLKKLRDSEEYTIAECVKQKVYEQDEVNRLKSEKLQLEVDLQTLVDAQKVAAEAKLAAESSKIALEEESKQLLSVIEEQKQIIGEQHEQHSARRVALDVHEKDIADKHEALTAREVKIVAREARIVKFVNEIQQEPEI